MKISFCIIDNDDLIINEEINPVAKSKAESKVEVETKVEVKEEKSKPIPIPKNKTNRRMINIIEPVVRKNLKIDKTLIPLDIQSFAK